MTTEVIEGEAIELDEPRSLVVVPPPTQHLVTAEYQAGPAEMIDRAAHMATALKDIVERQKLYAVIQGKKFPQVEAWMTIGRMDNVVAMEDGNPIRHDDGSYEAAVKLIRLSDGMTVGRGSALCGTAGDSPWDKRSEPNRRSMAVTRATSRAFRQQYSWIMALAGYEPTPADEMPPEAQQRPVGAHDTPPPRPELERRADGLIGTLEIGTSKRSGEPLAPVDLLLRETPDGYIWGFKLMAGRKGYQAVAVGPLAEALSVAVGPDLIGQQVQVWGHMEMVPWEKDGKAMPPFARIAIEKMQTDEWTLPAEVHAGEPPLDDDISGLEF